MVAPYSICSHYRINPLLSKKKETERDCLISNIGDFLSSYKKMSVQMNNDVEDDLVVCEACGSNALIPYVHYGSYLLKCSKCKSDLLATSFIAVINLMSGTIKATQIDEHITEIRIIAIGKIDEIKHEIQREANKGNMVRLEQM